MKQSPKKLNNALLPYIKDPIYARSVAQVILRAAYRSNGAMMADMMNEVRGKHDALDSERFRMMLREYARQEWQMELQ